MTIEYEFSKDIDASPQHVFDILVDLDALVDYVPGEVTVEQLTDEPFSVGTKWREHRKMMGREATEVFEVTEVVRPERLGLYVDGSKGTTGRGEFRYIYRLSEKDGQTRLVLESRIDGIGCVGETLSKLFAGSFKKAIDKDLEGLKDYVESRQKPPTGHT